MADERQYCGCLLPLFLLTPLLLGVAADGIDHAPPGQTLDLLRIVVLDTSGSMAKADKDGRSRLEVARVELAEAIAQFPPTSLAPVVLVPFAETVKDSSIVVCRDLATFQSAISGLHPEGNTDIAAALIRAVEEAETRATVPHILVYLYTDGEQTVGGPERVESAEEKLDGLFGQRAEQGLSQAVMVKRWGGVNAQLVARLSRSPDVDVYDAGQLAFRTVTFIPSAKVRSVGWADPGRLLARIEIEMSLEARPTTVVPVDTVLTIACPVPGHHWVSPPDLTVDEAKTARSFTLEVPLDSARLGGGGDYEMPFRITAPKTIRTTDGVFFVTVAPPELRCRFPTRPLWPQVSVKAGLVARGQGRWLDAAQRVAAFPMRLGLAPRSVPALPWRGELEWSVRGIGGTRIDKPARVRHGHDGGRVDLTVLRVLPNEPPSHSGPQPLAVELELKSAPPGITLSSGRLLARLQAPPPAAVRTRLTNQVVRVGRGTWVDAIRRLVSVSVDLEVVVDGPLPPGATLDLVPSNGVTDVGGTPVTIRTGRQRITLAVTGHLPRNKDTARWQLQIEPPRSSCAIAVDRPAPINLAVPKPPSGRIVLTTGDGKSVETIGLPGDPAAATELTGRVQVVGAALSEAAARQVRVGGQVTGGLAARGGDPVRPGERLSLVIEPATRSTLIPWWSDLVVRGHLSLKPVNADPDVVLPGYLPLTGRYEARFKRVLLAAAGVVAGVTVFWVMLSMIRMQSHAE